MVSNAGCTLDLIVHMKIITTELIVRFAEPMDDIHSLTTALKSALDVGIAAAWDGKISRPEKHVAVEWALI